MSPRRAILGILVLVLLIGALAFWRNRRDATPSSSAAPAATTSSGSVPRSSSASAIPARSSASTDLASTNTAPPARPRLPRATWESLAADYPIAAKLNAPDSTMDRDLFAVEALLDAWRTNFPREGNPVGENHQITAALTGDNPLKVALLPPNHPAINEHGELCDRFGTPFRLHQLSGEHMEIRSAGPDRKFGTADDSLWSPPGAPAAIR